MRVRQSVKRFLAVVIKPTMAGVVRHVTGARRGGSWFRLSIAPDDKVVHTMRGIVDGLTIFSWYGVCAGASKSK